jgi:hypothetical protein
MTRRGSKFSVDQGRATNCLIEAIARDSSLAIVACNTKAGAPDRVARAWRKCATPTQAQL